VHVPRERELWQEGHVADAWTEGDWASRRFFLEDLEARLLGVPAVGQSDMRLKEAVLLNAVFEARLGDPRAGLVSDRCVRVVLTLLQIQ
jgi:hypothetical protein